MQQHPVADLVFFDTPFVHIRINAEAYTQDHFACGFPDGTQELAMDCV